MTPKDAFVQTIIRGLPHADSFEVEKIAEELFDVTQALSIFQSEGLRKVAGDDVGRAVVRSLELEKQALLGALGRLAWRGAKLPFQATGKALELGAQGVGMGLRYGAKAARLAGKGVYQALKPRALNPLSWPVGLAGGAAKAVGKKMVSLPVALPLGFGGYSGWSAYKGV